MTEDEKTEMFSRGLLLLAEDLRMQNNGSRDPWLPLKVATVTGYLRSRLTNWRPSSRVRSEVYDNAVRTLVSAALAEVGHENELKELRAQIRSGT